MVIIPAERVSSATRAGGATATEERAKETQVLPDMIMRRSHKHDVPVEVEEMEEEGDVVESVDQLWWYK
jgi:hypothetical protein